MTQASFLLHHKYSCILKAACCILLVILLAGGNAVAQDKFDVLGSWLQF